MNHWTTFVQLRTNQPGVTLHACAYCRHRPYRTLRGLYRHLWDVHGLLVVA